jgi:hypothetical protein
MYNKKKKEVIKKQYFLSKKEMFEKSKTMKIDSKYKMVILYITSQLEGIGKCEEVFLKKSDINLEEVSLFAKIDLFESEELVSKFFVDFSFKENKIFILNKLKQDIKMFSYNQDIFYHLSLFEKEGKLKDDYLLNLIQDVENLREIVRRVYEYELLQK